MRRQFFCYIVDSIAKYDDPWFDQKRSALEGLGLSTLHKCIVAIHMLVYGLFTNVCNQYYKLGESTTFECMKKFVVAICACFESTYLKQPT